MSSNAAPGGKTEKEIMPPPMDANGGAEELATVEDITLAARLKALELRAMSHEAQVAQSVRICLELQRDIGNLTKSIVSLRESVGTVVETLRKFMGATGADD